MYVWESWICILALNTSVFSIYLHLNDIKLESGMSNQMCVVIPLFWREMIRRGFEKVVLFRLRKQSL